MELQPVAVLEPTSSNRTTTRWDLCVICQGGRKDLREATEISITKFKESFGTRKKFLDSSSTNLFDRLSDKIDNLSKHQVKWHKNCYAGFTNKANIQCIENRFRRKTPTALTNKDHVYQCEVQQRSSRSIIGATNLNICILCQKKKKQKGALEKLVQVQSQQIVERLKEIASTDDVLRCRLGVQDPIATEMKYHCSCLYKYQCKPKKSEDLFGIAFTELIKHVDGGFASGHIYALSSLTEMYNNILSGMGKEKANYKPYRLLQKIKNYYGDKIESVAQHRKNESTLIVPKLPTAVAIQVLKRLCNEHCENVKYDTLSTTEKMGDENQLMTRMFFHVAQKIKYDLSSVEGLENNVTEITNNAAARIVPDSLQILLNLILTSENKTDEYVERQSLSIGQDIVYAFNKKLTPKHIGIALTVHQATRSKNLIDYINAAGHCVNYDTVRRIETSLGNHLLQKFQANGNIYIPENLVSNKFVHFATDNIDILEETLDGKGTFHGTQIIAFQRGNSNKDVEAVPLGKSKTLIDVPPELLNVPSGPFIKNPLVKTAPNIEKNTFSENSQIKFMHRRDMTWLICRSEKAAEQIIPSWTDMNKVLTEVNHQISTIGYTPILPNPAHESDTLCAVLQRCQAVTKALGQKHTVITADEALYCKMKQIQWHSDEFSDVVVRLGGFHWLLNFMKVIGKHFAGSGLSEIWIESGVFGENTANNIIEGKQYNRAIRSIKLTFDALWRLLMFKLKVWATENNEIVEFQDLIKTETDFSYPSLHLMETWQTLESKVDAIFELLDKFDKHNKENSLYQYWRTYLNLAALVLKFIRAEREGDWQLHMEAVSQMLPWFFIYDHTNYARWGTVYLMDMKGLCETAKDVYEEFSRGNFVVKQAKKTFNQKSPDLALEHVNKTHKIAGGLIGITRNDTARDRWCLTFNLRSHLSDMARKMTMGEYDDAHENPYNRSSYERDESDIQKILETFKKTKLFEKENDKLINIFTGETASDEIATDLLGANIRGSQMAEEFLVQRLIDKTVDFNSPLKKVKSKTFRNLYELNMTMKSCKKDVTINANSLIRQMFSAVKSGRQLDLKQILQNELKDPPPSLFDPNGQMRQSPKSVLSNILIDKSETRVSLVSEPKSKTAVLLDGQALIQTIGKPKNATTFGDLASVFLKVVMFQFKKEECQSVHVLFDRYNELSIKSGMREKRKQSVTPVELKIADSGTPLPRKWDRFIHHSGNKRNLAKFISENIVLQAVSVEGDCELLTAGGFEDPLDVKTNVNRDIRHLMCNHEEADTRFVIHGIDAAQMGYETLIVNSRDTDVMLLLTYFYEKLPPKVWVQFGTSQKSIYVPIHDIARSMGPEKNNLLAFHALTGCDSTSSLFGFTKRSSWKVFIEWHTLLDKFGSEEELREDVMVNGEKFIIAIYCDKKPTLQAFNSIDDLRAVSFPNIKNLDKLPPSREVLKHHLYRANYQAYIWKTANIPFQTIPSPENCGWRLYNNSLIPIKSLKPPISLKDIELITCQCKSNCRTAKCSCARSKQKCMIGVCHIGKELCFNQHNYEDVDE